VRRGGGGFWSAHTHTSQGGKEREGNFSTNSCRGERGKRLPAQATWTEWGGERGRKNLPKINEEIVVKKG